MAERKAISRSARAPLQERIGMSNVVSSHALPGNSNAPQPSLTNKIGYEAAMPKYLPSSTAALGVRKPVTSQRTAPDSNDIQRIKIASLQKPAIGASLSSSKTYNVPTPNPLLKVRQPALAPERPSAPVVHRGSEKQNPQQSAPKRPATQEPIQPQPNQNPKQAYGSLEWIQSIAQSLQHFKFYFDNVDSNTVAKLTKTLTIYSSSVSKFFSSEVTHVVTTSSIPNMDADSRSKSNTDKTTVQNQPTVAPGKQSVKPPQPTPNAESSVLVKAMGFGIKIWSLERTLLLLGPLMAEPITQKENRNLQDYLRHEQVYGLTTTQNDESSRADYHVFRGPFVLIEDSTGRHRTILAYEYPPKSSESPACPWPRIHVQTTSRSPFRWYEDRSHRTKKRLGKGDNDTKEVVTKDVKEEHETAEEVAPHTNCGRSAAVSALVSGIVNSVTSAAISTHSAVGKNQTLLGAQGAQDRVLEQLEKRVLTATPGKVSAPSADVKKAEFVHPSNIIKSTKSIKHDMGHVPGADMGKNAMATATHPKSGAIGQPSAIAQQVVMPTPDVSIQATKDHESKPVPTPKATTQPATRKDRGQMGFCENCRGYYYDFEKHIATAEHRRYAHDSSKFEQLDKLLALLHRKPKASPQVVESENDRGGVEISAQESAATNDTDEDELVRAPVIDQNLVLIDNTDYKLPTETEHMNSTGPLAMEKESMDHQPEQEERLDVGDNAPMETVEATTSRDLTSDQHDTETIVEADIAADDEEDELSSELSRLDVSESVDNHCQLINSAGAGVRADVEADVDAKVEAVVDAENEAEAIFDTEEKVDEEYQTGTPTSATFIPETEPSCSQDEGSNLPEPKPHLRPPFRFPPAIFDSEAASHLETDITQPDEQFIGDSVADSQVTDPATPIRLCLSMTSTTHTDSLEPTETPAKEQPMLESLIEEQYDDDTNDDVALVKSPSAGRGTYARSQAAQINNGAFGMPPSARGELKRKFEIILEEERKIRRKEHEMDHTLDSPSPQQPILYDASLQSRLLSRPIHHQTTLPNPLSHGSMHRQPSMLDTTSSPLSFEGYQASSPVVAVPPSRYNASSYPLPQDRIPNQYDWNARIEGVQMNTNYNAPHLAHRSIFNSPSNQKVQRLNRDHERTHPQFQSVTVPSAPQFQPNLPSMNARFSGNCMMPTTPTSHLSSLPYSYGMSHSQFGGHSPRESSNYYDSGYRSPSQSPSQRTMYRTQLAVMTHAEQERERCYQHYRGNHLPETAGQKKLRGSSDPAEFEEYGEGCT
ncbi:hypothetical protein BGX31_008138, partial [Mortierella sp. GBA43]